MNKLKLFVLGIIVYLSKSLFFKVGGYWFEEIRDRDEFEQRVDVLRKRFWKSLFLVVLVTGLTVIYLIQSGRAVIDDKLLLRLSAIVMTLTATLGRGGWDLQSLGGNTVVERIDRGMFMLSQLGATVLLLLILTMR